MKSVLGHERLLCPRCARKLGLTWERASDRGIETCRGADGVPHIFGWRKEPSGDVVVVYAVPGPVQPDDERLGG